MLLTGKLAGAAQLGIGRHRPQAPARLTSGGPVTLQGNNLNMPVSPSLTESYQAAARPADGGLGKIPAGRAGDISA